jgi:hypothetical protein
MPEFPGHLLLQSPIPVGHAGPGVGRGDDCPQPKGPIHWPTTYNRRRREGREVLEEEGTETAAAIFGGWTAPDARGDQSTASDPSGSGSENYWGLLLINWLLILTNLKGASIYC